MPHINSKMDVDGKKYVEKSEQRLSNQLVLPKSNAKVKVELPTESIISPRMKRIIKPMIEPELIFEQDLTWKCKWCSQIYPSREKLATHILVHYYC